MPSGLLHILPSWLGPPLYPWRGKFGVFCARGLQVLFLGALWAALSIGLLVGGTPFARWVLDEGLCLLYLSSLGTQLYFWHVQKYLLYV